MPPPAIGLGHAWCAPSEAGGRWVVSRLGSGPDGVVLHERLLTTGVVARLRAITQHLVVWAVNNQPRVSERSVAYVVVAAVALDMVYESTGSTAALGLFAVSLYLAVGVAVVLVVDACSCDDALRNRLAVRGLTAHPAWPIARAELR